MTGAEMIVKIMEENGVKIVFGYPGAANAPIIDKLSFSGIKHILTRNEQGAAHMASGYARVTQEVGVCTATSGPGATNLITGLGTAYMDSIPMVALTGQVGVDLIGRDAFQEVDITGATLPVTKHSYLIKDGMDIPRILNEAFFIAKTGRPGPVLIDFPMDILKKEYDYPEEIPEVHIRGYRPNTKPNESQIKKLADAIKVSKQPVILAGGGIVISDALDEIRTLVKNTEIPVVATMMGIGTIPVDDPHYFGMVGSHGFKRSNIILNKADLVIVMGSRLGDRTVAHANNFENNRKIVHIDIDPAEIGKNVQSDIPIVGDIKVVLSSLIPLLMDYKVSQEWLSTVKDINTKFAEEVRSDDYGTVNPKFFMQKLAEMTNSQIYVATEVGQNQIWAANYFNYQHPRNLLTSGGFGTMGYGLPAAIGAATVAKKPVVAIMGDGSFQMDLPELGTMSQWGIPVKMVVFKNDRLGMVHEHQYLLYNSNYQAVDLDGSPDFNKLADAYRIPNGHIKENSDIEDGINALMQGDGSYLLVVDVSPYEPTGGALNENLLSKKEVK